MITPARFPRADRRPLQIAINYRLPGDEDWIASHVLNLSESGVLFGPTELRAGAAVQMMFSLPMPVGSRFPGPQMCEGKVVRTTETGTAAARFDACRFLLES
jgi:hypothetical protein